LALVHEYRYFYAAIGPQNGTLHWMVAERMNTESMSLFLGQVGQTHPDRHVVMVLDGASSHRAKALEIPENISLIHLPPFSPELNPTEILWHESREKCCANREVEAGLQRLGSEPKEVSRLSGWSWIINGIVLNAA
jgi:transposase